MKAIDILRELLSKNNGLILTKIAAEKGISSSNLSMYASKMNVLSQVRQCLEVLL